MCSGLLIIREIQVGITWKMPFHTVRTVSKTEHKTQEHIGDDLV